jgi:MFS family permease
MQQESFSPQESLAIIQNMIAKTRSNMGDNSKYFLLWGWATFAGFIGQFLLKNVWKYEQHYLVWLVTIPAVLVTIMIGKRQKNSHRVTTYMQDSMKHLWLGMGISFFVLCIIFSRMGWGNNIYPFFILMYGLGTFISGKLLQFTPLVAGGIAAWVLAIAATYTTYDYQMLFAAAAIMASYIVPAHILRKRQQSENTNY